MTNTPKNEEQIPSKKNSKYPWKRVVYDLKKWVAIMTGGEYPSSQYIGNMNTDAAATQLTLSNRMAVVIYRIFNSVDKCGKHGISVCLLVTSATPFSDYVSWCDYS